MCGQIQDGAELFASIEGEKKTQGENKLVFRMILFAFTVCIVYTLHEYLIISDIIKSSDCKNSQY